MSRISSTFIRSIRSTLGAITMAAAATFAGPVAQAAPFTLHFEASGFENNGTQWPGHAGLIQGSVSWEGSDRAGAIDALTDIELEIGGHRYLLNEVAGNGSSTWGVFGGLARGWNAVVGDGAFHDFMLIIDRVNPQVITFAFTIEGKSNAIWWFPTHSRAWFGSDVASVPTPGALTLAALALLAAGSITARSRRRRAASLQVQSNGIRSA